MTNPGPYVCNLDVRDVDNRLEQFDALSRNLLGRERSGAKIRLRFPSELAATVRAFVRDESACCSFFSFDVAHAGDAVELTVQAPTGAMMLLDALFDSFDPVREKPA